MLQYERSLGASIHVAGHGAYDQALQLGIDARIKVAQVRRRGGRGGRPAREQVVKGGSKRIYVRACISLALAKLLEWSIGRRAHRHSVFPLDLFIGTRDPEAV